MSQLFGQDHWNEKERSDLTWIFNQFGSAPIPKYGHHFKYGTPSMLTYFNHFGFVVRLTQRHDWSPIIRHSRLLRSPGVIQKGRFRAHIGFGWKPNELGTWDLGITKQQDVYEHLRQDGIRNRSYASPTDIRVVNCLTLPRTDYSVCFDINPYRLDKASPIKPIRSKLHSNVYDLRHRGWRTSDLQDELYSDLYDAWAACWSVNRKDADQDKMSDFLIMCRKEVLKPLSDPTKLLDPAWRSYPTHGEYNRNGGILSVANNYEAFMAEEAPRSVIQQVSELPPEELIAA